MNDNIYVLIHGYKRSLFNNDRAVEVRDANEYIAGIVYGEPEITTVVTDSGKFVALCEYERDHMALANHTFYRMGSFAYGAQYVADRVTALTEFGSWIYHYSATRHESADAVA